MFPGNAPPSLSCARKMASTKIQAAGEGDSQNRLQYKCNHPGLDETAGIYFKALSFIHPRIKEVIELPSNAGDEKNDLEFGRDGKRLDYFSVTPFEVNGDDHLRGGGGATTPQVPAVVETNDGVKNVIVRIRNLLGRRRIWRPSKSQSGVNDEAHAFL